jgi:hypothetical protein
VDTHDVVDSDRVEMYGDVTTNVIVKEWVKRQDYASIKRRRRSKVSLVVEKTGARFSKLWAESMVDKLPDETYLPVYGVRSTCVMPVSWLAGKYP